jgi:hypothetical protein
MKEKRIISTFTSLRYIFQYVDLIQDFFLKYDRFLERLDKTFGTELMRNSKDALKIITEMRTEIDQVRIFVSKKQFETANSLLPRITEDSSNLVKNMESIIAVSHGIDYSKLTNGDWKMIGIAGLHYRSNVFLSYPFRDVDPRRDSNEEFITDYVMPFLELLNIIPVTARSRLKSDELIDDRICELIGDCDGIIAFYTRDDKVDNVEHELSKCDNVIAVCKEEGAAVPPMRLSRLMINFQREKVGDFLLELMKTQTKKCVSLGHLARASRKILQTAVRLFASLIAHVPHNAEPQHRTYPLPKPTKGRRALLIPISFCLNSLTSNCRFKWHIIT